MKQREKAPAWVMGVMLLLLFYYSIVGFLKFLDLLPTSEWSLKTPHGWADFTILQVWWIGSVVSMIYFLSIATLSIKRQWEKVEVWGSIISAIIAVFWIIRLFLMWRAYVHNYIFNTDFDLIFNRFANLLEMIGLIMIAWGVKISKAVRIAVIAYLCLTYLIGWFPITWTYDLGLYYNMGRPMLVIGLLIISCLYKRKNETEQL